MGIMSIDINLIKKWVLGILFFASELFDSCIVTWLLACKLVARKCENFKSLAPIFLVELIHQCVAFLRESAFRCNVDNHSEFLALENITEFLDLLSIDILYWNFVDAVEVCETLDNRKLIEILESDFFLLNLIIFLDGFGFRIFDFFSPFSLLFILRQKMFGLNPTTFIQLWFVFSFWSPPLVLTFLGLHFCLLLFLLCFLNMLPLRPSWDHLLLRLFVAFLSPRSSLDCFRFPLGTALFGDCRGSFWLGHRDWLDSGSGSFDRFGLKFAEIDLRKHIVVVVAFGFFKGTVSEELLQLDCHVW